MRILAAILTLALAACQTPGVITETKIERVNVPVRAPCPDPETKAAVDAARPVPLRDYPADQVPETEEGRRALERQQLGRYEAPGQWADQAQAVMDRCADEGVEPLESD